MIFRKWGGGGKALWNCFQKFIRFGSRTLPVDLEITTLSNGSSIDFFVPSGVRQSTPRVSYVSFLDIWMVSWLSRNIFSKVLFSVLSGGLPSLRFRLYVWVPRGHNMFTEGGRALQRRGGNFRSTCISIRLDIMFLGSARCLNVVFPTFENLRSRFSFFATF